MRRLQRCDYGRTKLLRIPYEYNGGWLNRQRKRLDEPMAVPGNCWKLVGRWIRWTNGVEWATSRLKDTWPARGGRSTRAADRELPYLKKIKKNIIRMNFRN